MKGGFMKAHSKTKINPYAIVDVQFKPEVKEKIDKAGIQ